MSAELELPDDGPLTEAAAARQVEALRAAREHIAGADLGEAIDAKKQAEMIRAWVRIHDAAHKITIEAHRLEATALRRIFQLDPSRLKGNTKSTAEWLAQMTDRQFSEFLEGSSLRYYTPVGAWMDSRKSEREATARKKAGAAAGGGNGAAEIQQGRLIQAAVDILHSAAAKGNAQFSEMVENLADELGYDLSSRNEDAGTYNMRRGVEAIIDEALRLGGNADPEDRHPDVITWHDEKLGWLRIPWRIASPHQLRWMADFRQTQAAELQKAADSLSSLATDLEDIAQEHPAAQGLPALWEIWERRHQSQEDQ